jgi:hypothetical protein
MSLKHNTVVPSVSQQMTVHNTDTKGCDEAVNQLCQLYPEIASWQPELIAGAWHQWCAENQRQLMPEERDEAFTLYLVSLSVTEWRR